MAGLSSPFPSDLIAVRNELNRLHSRSRGVVAVLVLAAEWPDRFPKGWVRTQDVYDHVCDYVPRKPTNEQSDADVRGLARAWEQLKVNAQVFGFEVVPDTRHRKRRRLAAVPPSLVDWLYADHEDYIQPDTWRRFLLANVRQPSSQEEVLGGLYEVAAEIMMAQGRNKDALKLILDRLEQPSAALNRSALMLAKARALVRRGRQGDWREAYQILTDLSAAPPPSGSFRDRLLRVRVLIDLSYAHFITRMMGVKDAKVVEREAAVVRAWIKQALDFEPVLSHADLARARSVEALVTKCYLRTTTGKDRDGHFRRADHLFMESFELYRLAGEPTGLGNVTYNLGELRYVYHRLDEEGASEEHILDALRWYRQSTSFNDLLLTNRDRLYDYPRVADCLGLLVQARAGTASREELLAMLGEARQMLQIVRDRGNEIEQDLADWTEARLDAHAYGAGVMEVREGDDPKEVLAALHQPSMSLRDFEAGRKPWRRSRRDS